jgi:penicillin V acylase-like amidase (Ntn superfamily)
VTICSPTLIYDGHQLTHTCLTHVARSPSIPPGAVCTHQETLDSTCQQEFQCLRVFDQNSAPSIEQRVQALHSLDSISDGVSERLSTFATQHRSCSNIVYRCVICTCTMWQQFVEHWIQQLPFGLAIRTLHSCKLLNRCSPHNVLMY